MYPQASPPYLQSVNIENLHSAVQQRHSQQLLIGRETDTQNILIQLQGPGLLHGKSSIAESIKRNKNEHSKNGHFQAL